MKGKICNNAEDNQGFSNGGTNRRVSFRYLVHDLAIVIYEFFFGEYRKKPADDLNLLQQAKILLESRQDTDTISLCKDLIKIHRVHENTKSRKRLEIWATLLITTYLIAISAIFVLTTVNFYGQHLLQCDSQMMVALLTTTTINIIGLVVIVLKGYFPQKLKNKEKDLENETE